MYYWEVQGPGLPYCCRLTSCTTSPEGLIMTSVGTCTIYKSSVALEPIVSKFTCSEDAVSKRITLLDNHSASSLPQLDLTLHIPPGLLGNVVIARRCTITRTQPCIKLTERRRRLYYYHLPAHIPRTGEVSTRRPNHGRLNRSGAEEATCHFGSQG